MTPGSPAKILFVDDEANLLAAMQRNLRKLYTFDTALGAAEALRLLKETGPYAVIVADMSMPGMNGVELLEEVRKLSPDTVRLMLTGNADQKSAVDAVNRGKVHRFLNKPCAPELLVAALNDALKQHELITVEKTLLEQTLNGALQMLTDILAGLDADAFGQAQLRRAVARETAKAYGITSTWDIEIAAQLADLGRVALPAALREKIRQRHLMTANERQLIERIPEFSARLLANIPRLEGVAKTVLYQNKNFDGTGFPADDVSGNEIPLHARILHAVNGLLALHANGMASDDAIKTVQRNKEHYDAALGPALANCAALLKTAPAPATSGVRRLTLAELSAGYVLVSDIVTLEGVVVLAAGITLEAVHVNRLKNFAALNPIAEPITVDVPARADAVSVS